MKTYFIRHTEKLDIDQETFDSLLENNEIAVHFPFLENWGEQFDTTSLNLNDYKQMSSKKAIKALIALSKEGGYVCAEYRTLKGAVIGLVPPKTQVILKEGKWGDKNNFQGRNAILKTLQLTNVKRIEPSKYLDISSGRPRQGTIAIWRSVGNRIESLVENKPLEQILQNLSSTQQEVMCSEYLRSGLDKNILPKIETLLLPVGRTLRDVDIVGLDDNNETIYSQVTYAKFNRGIKFKNLQKYALNERKAIYFCNCSKPEILDCIIVYPLSLVFYTFNKSEIGKRWINNIFN